MPNRVGKPLDTSAEAWEAQRAAWRRMGPEGRLRVALDLSDQLREIHLAGIIARNPGWDRRRAVQYLIERNYSVRPEPR